jgi:non-canonical (house-cleaning) NTP pyrophosphatase
MGIGLEGGVDPDGSLISCVAVVGIGGQENLTWGVRFPLPPVAAARALNGEELGPVIDELTGHNESKKQLGAVGLLTNGIFTRTEMMQGPLACALIPFLHPTFYSHQA